MGKIYLIAVFFLLTLSIFAQRAELVDAFKAKEITSDTKIKPVRTDIRGRKVLNVENPKSKEEFDEAKQKEIEMYKEEQRKKQNEKMASQSRTMNSSKSNDNENSIQTNSTKINFNTSNTITTKTNDGDVINIPILTHLEKIDSKAMIHLDFYESELEHVVKYISDITGTNFILPQNLKGKKVTIMSPKKIKALDALNAFFTILNMNNYSVIRSGGFFQIVPVQDANKPNFIYYQNQKVPNVDYFVTKIYNLKYAQVRDIEIFINKIRSRNGSVVSYEPSSLLIYTDTGYNVNTAFEIIKKIDVPSNYEGTIWMIPIYYSDAKEIATILEEIFDLKKNNNNTNNNKRVYNAMENKNLNQKNVEKASGASATHEESDDETKVQIQKIIPEERSNQLIVISNEDSKEKLINLVKKLDIPMTDDSSIHVYYLQNAKAEEIATTINALATGSSSSSTNRRGSRNNTNQQAKTASGLMFQGEVKVTADKSTNTLVITASKRDYNALRRVIEMLDLKRRQVYVEAVIMELSIDKDFTLGVSADGGVESLATVKGENIPAYGGTNWSTSLSAISVNPAALTGFAFGISGGPEISITDDLSIPSFGLILKALQTNSNTNVLSSPHVLTMDNEEAEFIVGENVPFPSGISSSIGGSTSSSYYPVVSIQRQDVAIKLTITPQISGDNQVKLDVKQEITEVKSVDEIKGPTTSKRSVKTTVVVPDQQTIVIGGLIKDNISETVNKVPLLGDIPVLGHLFRYQNKRTSKSNLMVFLTPYIVTTPQDMDKIWKKKMEEHKEFERLKERLNKGFDIFIDYDKKRGLFSEINKEVDRFDSQKEMDASFEKKRDIRYDVDFRAQHDEKIEGEKNYYNQDEINENVGERDSYNSENSQNDSTDNSDNSTEGNGSVSNEELQ
ncbi:type II secretion system secretin GspD [bacterium]|nr:type II secretion system secretin GspD [bacterium]